MSSVCQNCSSDPCFQITWLDNWNSPIKHHIETITETLPDGKRKNTRSVLKLPMKKSHHNTSITCEALNSAESVPQSTRHNSDLSDILEYTFCFLICGVRRITIDKSRSFCRLVSTKSNSLLLCLVKSKNLRTPHVFLYVLMGVSQI